MIQLPTILCKMKYYWYMQNDKHHPIYKIFVKHKINQLPKHYKTYQHNSII